MNIFNWSCHRVGGIWFWKLGRFGGSFYVARRVPRTFQWEGDNLPAMLVNLDR